MNNNRPIKVAYVINSILVAGAEMMLFETAIHLDRERFLPTVYVLRDYGSQRASLAERFADANIPVIFLQRANEASIRGAIGLLWNHFKISRPDIVHGHLPDAVITGSIAAMMSRIPFVIHEHQTHRFHSWKIRLAYRLLRPFSSLTISYAETLEKEIFGNACVLEVPPKNIARTSYTIRNGIDIERVAATLRDVDRDLKRRELGFSSEDIVILSVARLVEWKGHRLLIEAFGVAAPRALHIRLVIVGDGPLFAELSLRIGQLGLQDRITIMGLRSDVYELLVAADIFSLVFAYPAGIDAEPVGIAGFEAMAFGLPVVIGRYTGTESYIGDDERGIGVIPRNEYTLSDALLSLAADPSRRNRLGTAAQIFAQQKLNWNAIIKIYERIYTLILSV